MLKGIENYSKKLTFTVVLGLILLLIYHGIHMLLILFAGILLAILWRGVSRRISKRTRIPFNACLPAIVLINIGLLVLFIWLSYPSIAEQTQKLKAEIPKVTKKIENDLQNSDVGQLLLQVVENNGNPLQEYTGKLGKVFTVFADTLSIVVDIVLVLVFALFLVADPGLYIKGFLHLIPTNQRPRIQEVIFEIKDTLFRWFIGKIADMFSIFIMTTIGLWILGMPLVFTFALIAFLFSFVPNIGPILSAIPPVAIAILEGPKMPLYVGLLYLGIQMFESYFVTPNIQKHASYVPPVLLLLVQFLLAAFVGVLGLLLSTPLLVAFMVGIRMLYVEDYLKDTSAKN